MQAAAYSIDIYCDVPDCYVTCELPEGHATATGQTYAQCRRQLQRAGWQVATFRGRGKDLCPEHNPRR